MEDALKQIWKELGIQPGWAAVLTLCVFAIVFLTKALISQRSKKALADHKILADQFDIAEFVKEESIALTEAYLKIFEGKDTVDARREDFIKIVAQADNELMAPLRKHQAKLDDETKAKIFFVHNILAQYYPDASEEAIKGFKKRKSDFYAHKEDAIRALKPDLILQRLGVVSRRLRP